MAEVRENPLQSFTVSVPGKWILAGEHSVLRGAPALVFPLTQRTLTLTHAPAEFSLELDLSGDYGPEFRVLFWNLIERACNQAGVKKSHLTGTVKLSSQIPVGSGLGASAALCVAVGQWFENLKFIKSADVYEFSRNLENLFHGESSGVDVAVTLLKEPIRFLRNGDRQKIKSNWQPHLYLSYSGRKGSTLDCVQRVKAFGEKNPSLGKELDQQMAASVAMAEKALASEGLQGLKDLASSIMMAKDCFDRWGLTPELEIQSLLGAGAIAAKPTGSGGGGYILSLWEAEPPLKLREFMTPCF